MTSNTTFLITGGNRGLGRAFVELYLVRDNHTIIAAVRNPEHETSQALLNLPRGESSKIIVVKIDSASQSDPVSAVEELKSTHGITSLDIVLANAAIAKGFPAVHEATPSAMTEHFDVNVIGVILLYQAVRPLLLESRAKLPKFITMGSGVASFSRMEELNLTNTSYATSKVALNYITRRIHLENPNLIAFPIDPGWVQTEMGNAGAVLVPGFEEAPMTIKESVTGVARVIDEATKENYSGKFILHDGTVEPW